MVKKTSPGEREIFPGKNIKISPGKNISGDKESNGPLLSWRRVK